MVEFNQKVKQTIIEVMRNTKQDELTISQFLKLLENVLNENFEKTDLKRMIESLKLKSESVYNED